ncbi:MFS transporter [Polaribacter reichenbachii]|uniref:MFS transporter n=1 Tax=Polaribacter reichenbachii TaxID=996801 RepID=A0A1B8U7C3_9FLAO|nr:MFS transporter [Polaribacter reichenbachii]APZ46481.1 MFS transporter [Polaribacter reichenbachii]AUC20346.1 MFS transporter [Polaribacter reichenbachii]OBY67752.1 MFS transporter [Polaribacter reichenbachii]
MKKLFTNYINTFKGLSTEVWWLSLITLINRAGTMVIPFLSLYLNKSLGFSLENIGWILSFWGLGSVVGTWLGGKLTDKVGYYKVMFVSLLFTGIFFFLLQYITTFVGFCFGIFIVMLVADIFRPAMFVALSAYSKPENKTRSVTLIRLAINLGFSAGPAVGGLIITNIGYNGLFWVDGITCVLAAILLLKVLHPKKAKVLDLVKVEKPVSVYSDKIFWLFFIAMFIFGFTFMQYFSTMPLYYKDICFLSEFEIGLLMGFNGFFIFVFEMPLISWLVNSKHSKVKLIALGLLLVAISFVVLNFTSWLGILLIGMLFMTVGEMIAFPFSNSFALERGKKGNQGEYMAMYAMSFSLASIFSHNTGMQMIDKFGYEFTWYFMSAFAFLGVGILVFLLKILQKKSNQNQRNFTRLNK